MIGTRQCVARRHFMRDVRMNMPCVRVRAHRHYTQKIDRARPVRHQTRAKARGNDGLEAGDGSCRRRPVAARTCERSGRSMEGQQSMR
jgi:hypothetical protein